MAELAHAAEIEVSAPAERVWEAITNPTLTRRYYYGCEIEGDWRPGGAWRYRTGGRQVVVDGTVLEARPPWLLRLTARELWDPVARDDPAHRISWQVEALTGGRSRVRLTHDGFEAESASYRINADLEPILRGLRNLVDPEAAAALRRLDSIGRLEVLPLTPDRLDDFLDFFDHRAFADNPSWGFCYCFNYRFAGTPEEASVRAAVDNRRDMSEHVRDGRAHGLLAYSEGGVAGWCSATPRGEMSQLERADWMPAAAGRTGMIGCLVVAAPFRRHGVARLLIESALGYLAGLGCTAAEAYPLKELDSDVHGHFGPIQVYRDLGFATVRDLPGRIVMRKALTVVPWA